MPAAPAIAFDIDGVFKAGRYFFPDGLKALADARAAGCAVVFVTNGGGGLGEEEYLLGFKKKILSASGEADPATKALLAKELDGIGVESMILSYTPMGEDLSFKKKRVLLVGDPKEKVKAAAASYGWKNAVHVSEYVKKHSTVDPFGAARSEGKSHSAVVNSPGPRPAGPSHGDAVGGASGDAMHEECKQHDDCFDCVVVMTDPHDWFESLQVVIDVVVSADPNSTDSMEFDIARHVPVHFSNPDIFWKAEHPQPRFGQGAFRLAFEALLRSRLNLLKAPPALVDVRLRECVVQWGKPSEAALQCAERRLAAMRRQTHASSSSHASDSSSDSNGSSGGGGNSSSSSPSFSSLSTLKGDGSDENNFWMVGDNPASDMALAALGGHRWRGCLVKTGVYVDSDATCGAEAAVEGVSDSVAFILKQHALECGRQASEASDAAKAALATAEAAEAAAKAAVSEAKKVFAASQSPPIEACTNQKCGFSGCTCGAKCACGGGGSQTGGGGGGEVCDPCQEFVATKKKTAAAAAVGL